MIKHFFTSLFLLLNSVAWAFATQNPPVDYTATLKKVTDVMVYDVTSPVASARYYAYINLAAYETLSKIDPSVYPSLTTVLRLPAIKIDRQIANGADAEQAVLFTILKAGERFLPSGVKLRPEIEVLKAHFLEKKAANVAQSAALADEIVKQVFAWSITDGFRQLNNLQRYTPKSAPEFWKPTAPAFMAPVEPHWRTVRTFLLDSAQQFKPQLPTPFDTSVGSAFYRQVKEVQNVVNAKNKKQQAIANFWDCNPYAITQIGHVEFGTKKISPGGHWVGITGIACRKARLSLEKTVVVHTILAITLHDAFVACWDEKYRSHRVRPETVINQFFDPHWRPLLQTPPFPEYLSGHSVASTACATVLTRFFGEKFKFTDDTEVEFGIPKRSFPSFKQAADEACLSRLYGGIHYMDAIEQGKWQGGQIGDFSVRKLAQLF